MGLPLYEGVDWNHTDSPGSNQSWCLPLYEGVDWNVENPVPIAANDFVSLFTREWIEIVDYLLGRGTNMSLPLYEGVDWNNLQNLTFHTRKLSPSLRGSGLKFLREEKIRGMKRSPSLRGSGLKYPTGEKNNCHRLLSPSLRGSGLKSFVEQTQTNANSLPLYEGVDWNFDAYCKIILDCVSLFTREWIEICSNVPCFPGLCRVSLFTREWIEISS